MESEWRPSSSGRRTSPLLQRESCGNITLRQFSGVNSSFAQNRRKGNIDHPDNPAVSVAAIQPDPPERPDPPVAAAGVAKVALDTLDQQGAIL